MKLIVGLGNPGAEYELTPHNMGFLAVDQLAEDLKVLVNNRHCKALTARARIGNEEVLLAKPETFMNLSGNSVRELLAKYGGENEIDAARDLIVVHDELDFELGIIRIKERGSSAGHNGIESIMDALGTDAFIRVRVGVAPAHPISDGARYVLSAWKKKDLVKVGEVVDQAEAAVKAIVEEGVSAAMNRFNRKPDIAGASGEKV
ncbi:MAG TPA: aminoacyl-tRNA hydrolase [Terriglobales bacterium]|nr:aminoacyl-tRNA hydrolase [Terriglobales bacterium]